MYMQKLMSIWEWPNLEYADVKLNFAYTYRAGCVHACSLCEYFDLYRFGVHSSTRQMVGKTQKIQLV